MEFLQQVDPVAVATLVFAVVGFVELYKRVYDRDWRVVGIIAVSALAGAVFAPQVGNVSWFVGMLIGFSASGVVTTVRS